MDAGMAGLLRNLAVDALFLQYSLQYEYYMNSMNIRCKLLSGNELLINVYCLLSFFI